MHEMSIVLAVVEQVEEAARANGAGTVEAVRLRIGELAGVVPDALDFCFELACAGTVLEGARLLTEPVPARARCAPCAHEWATGMPPQLCCPRCGEGAAELLAGHELQITGVRWSVGQGGGSPEAGTAHTGSEGTADSDGPPSARVPAHAYPSKEL